MGKPRVIAGSIELQSTYCCCCTGVSVVLSMLGQVVEVPRICCEAPSSPVDSCVWLESNSEST